MSFDYPFPSSNFISFVPALSAPSCEDLTYIEAWLHTLRKTVTIPHRIDYEAVSLASPWRRSKTPANLTSDLVFRGAHHLSVLGRTICRSSENDAVNLSGSEIEHGVWKLLSSHGERHSPR
jgi:hypothetical protein